MIHRLPWTLTLRRFLKSLDGTLAIVRSRPDGILLSFNGTHFALWAWAAEKLGIPVGVIVYDLRELWAGSQGDDRRMHKDTCRTLKRASVIWFVSEELREEYHRRVPGLNTTIFRVLPPIPGRIAVQQPTWREEFRKETIVTFAGGLKSNHHDVFRALMLALRHSGGQLVIVTQEKRLETLRKELNDFKDVLELRAMAGSPADGIRWAAGHSTCLLVHYSFDVAAEELSLTSFPSKLLEYSHLGLPILVAAPSFTTLGKWAQRMKWPLWLETLDSATVQETLNRLKDKEFWHHCARITKETAQQHFCPDTIHQRFAADVSAMMENANSVSQFSA